MPYDKHSIFKRAAEWVPKEHIRLVPDNTRGIYVLLKKRGSSRSRTYDVVYVGMARNERAGIKSRLRSHRRSHIKGPLWTHFSIYEVHDNVREEEIEDLEGFVRHIYRRDSHANKINKAIMHKRIKGVTRDLLKWST